MGINEKEFAVIRQISSNHKPTQRQIAKGIGISLGLTNLIIKRLIQKGYIKIQEAPSRTILYSLTPKGLAEKARKSYEFTLSTINLIKVIKDNIQDIISREYLQGARQFEIYGNGEITALTEIAVRDAHLSDIHYSKAPAQPEESNPRCHIVVSKNGSEKKIDILTELSKKGLG